MKLVHFRKGVGIPWFKFSDKFLKTFLEKIQFHGRKYPLKNLNICLA